MPLRVMTILAEHLGARSVREYDKFRFVEREPKARLMESSNCCCVRYRDRWTALAISRLKAGSPVRPVLGIASRPILSHGLARSPISLQEFMHYLVVFVGGGLGAALRHAVNRAAFALFGPSLPIATLFVNVVGSFAMGVVVALFLARSTASQDLKLFLTTGVLGGFTTFSAFSLDAATMWQRGDHAAVVVYAVASVVLSIGGLFLGMITVRAIG